MSIKVEALCLHSKQPQTAKAKSVYKSRDSAKQSKGCSQGKNQMKIKIYKKNGNPR